MLDIQDNGREVQVTNRDGEPVSVQIKRVQEQENEPYYWPRCDMFHFRQTITHTSAAWVDSGSSVTFHLREDCADRFVDAPIEYRVGKGLGDVGFWSDSALATTLHFRHGL